MKIAMLARNADLYSHRRLKEAAELRGHELDIINTLRCYMNIASRRPEIYYNGEKLPMYDAVIPRIGASVTFYGLAVLRQFEMMGVFTPNRADAVVRARDKLHCLQLLAQQELGLPGTVFGDNPDDTGDLLAMLGKPPHVIKLVEGAQGQGVVLAEKLAGSRSVIEALRGLYANFLVQEFIGEAKGADVRCFVVGGKVIAAMRRQAKAGEFRSNLHRGGSAEATRLTAAETDVAIRAAAVMGLGIAGVDLLRSKRGPLVLEVNSSPGLEGIEAATGVDVAGEIVAYLERRVRQAETRAERRASSTMKPHAKVSRPAPTTAAKTAKTTKKSPSRRVSRA